MTPSIPSIARRIAVTLILATAFTPVLARAEVKLPGVFSDHMVLQREMRVPVWGQAAPGDVVTVKFHGQSKTATADDQGKWMVKLDPLPTSAEPQDLVVSTGQQPPITIHDVLVGEVWVGSGQSNMQIGCNGFAKGDAVLAAALAAAPYSRLRLLHSGGQARWLEATAANCNGFSALAFSFGLRLQQELDVPVGLMVGAVGGTPSGFWLSEEALKADTACQELIRKFASNYDVLLKRHNEALAAWEKAAEAAKEQQKPAPRKPAAPVKPGDAVGGKVGYLYAANIRPFIPYGIRGVLWDQGESGTALPEVDQYTLMGALIRGWRAEWGEGEFPFIYIQKPSGGGCAWDPTNSVTRNADAFSPLPPNVPNDGAGVETFLRIREYPNTAMAISSDLGPGIHPVNKSGYGHRASDVALGMVYGRKVECYGPVYASHAVQGDKVRVRFTHVGQGLAFRHGEKLQGFAVAGADRVFHWADATIDGDAVVISSPSVSQPVAVSYAWSQNRTWANLFNQDGLPALPFRTIAR